jgi:hypothetical protein
MDINETRYCLAKQLKTMNEIATSYGNFVLDDEMREAVEKTLRPMLEKRIEKMLGTGDQ